MNIQDLINCGASINVTISLKDLQEWHKQVIADTKKELEEIVISEKAESYLSPKQVSEILDVDLVTLWRWAKKEYLAPFEIGGKRRYKMSDIEKLLNKKG
jgi:hypothetical protein